MKTLEMPRNISKEKRNACMIILGNAAFAKNIPFKKNLKTTKTLRGKLSGNKIKPAR